MKKGSKKPAKRFVVKIEIEGAMLDQDTPISRQALIDLFTLQFGSAKTYKIAWIDAEELPG